MLSVHINKARLRHRIPFLHENSLQMVDLKGVQSTVSVCVKQMNWWNRSWQGSRWRFSVTLCKSRGQLKAYYKSAHWAQQPVLSSFHPLTRLTCEQEVKTASISFSIPVQRLALNTAVLAGMFTLPGRATTYKWISHLNPNSYFADYKISLKVQVQEINKPLSFW